MSLSKLVDDPHLWQSFEAEINTRLDGARRKLEQDIDVHTMYRAQGEVASLLSLLKLRDKIQKERK